MEARNRHLLSFKAAFFTELLARAVAERAVPGAYRLIAIHVALVRGSTWGAWSMILAKICCWRCEYSK